MPSLVPEANGIALTDFLPGGRDTSRPWSCCCAWVRQARPHVVLEVETFDGNTTLQLGTNAPVLPEQLAQGLALVNIRVPP